jgi:sec-independent protein translocase protein TatC
MATPESDTPKRKTCRDSSRICWSCARASCGRLARCLVLVALVPFANRLYAELAKPLVARLPQGAHLIATEVTSPFITPLKLAFYAALFISMPMVLYQLWAFVSPGLYKHEKRLARPLLAAALVLFYMGGAFAYFLVLPAAFRFLTAVTPQGVEMMTDITHYLDFVMLMFFAFGLCFEVPVAVVIVAAIGLVDLAKLRSGAAVCHLRRLCGCRLDHAARHHLDADARHPDVPAVRAGHAGGALAGEAGIAAARFDRIAGVSRPDPVLIDRYGSISTDRSGRHPATNAPAAPAARP